MKDEIDELFKTHEKDDTLKEAFPCSEWVKIKEPDKAEYLVGVIYEEAAPHKANLPEFANFPED